ncbi:hypothetical protein IscW_ISCW018849 [Ixodes scapularis]|uniref:Uncharacterized protein n=1 Tax=Ixodes scapularis TaxID=6945 RepID=B7PNE7_IXOSC|nr:hypothetical protein IscW_ISCW018849 [Ixodes scapularis]|eukprot:XP_002435296.1 hypothetical protein IscW_ISCW018849 [Ixodes scapularis]
MTTTHTRPGASRAGGETLQRTKAPPRTSKMNEDVPADSLGAKEDTGEGNEEKGDDENKPEEAKGDFWRQGI